MFRRVQKEEQRKRGDLSWRQLISAVSTVKQSKNREMLLPGSFTIHFANGHLEILEDKVCFGWPSKPSILLFIIKKKIKITKVYTGVLLSPWNTSVISVNVKNNFKVKSLGRRLRFPSVSWQFHAARNCCHLFISCLLWSPSGLVS